MDYRRVYMRIISNAQYEASIGKRPKFKSQRNSFQEYYEFHHILPKSIFPLWAKRQSNIVALTAREHFFCHQLLTKIYDIPAMVIALWFLSNDNQNNYLNHNSKYYEKLREQHFRAQQKNWKNKSDLEKNQFKEHRSKSQKDIWAGRSVDERKDIGKKSWDNRTDKQESIKNLRKSYEDNKDSIKSKIKEAWESKTDTKEILSARCNRMNKDSSIIQKRGESIHKIMEERASDKEGKLYKRLASYNEKRKVKVKCIETGEIFDSVSSARKKYKYLNLSKTNNIMTCKKVVDGVILNFIIIE